MDPQALAQAVTGAQYYQPAAGVTPIPEITTAMQSKFAAPLARAQNQADSYNLDVAEANQKDAIKAKINSLQQKIDPRQYKKVHKADGGYDFFDPDGNQIDIATLTRQTGTLPQEWIDDSENPIDKQFLNDYKNLQEFMEAIYNNDIKIINKYKDEIGPYATEPGGIDRLSKDFKNHYRRYFVTQQEDKSAWGERPSAPMLQYRDEIVDDGTEQV